MDKQSIPIKSWRRLSVVWPLRTKPPGVNNSPGSNMPTIASPPQPPDCPPLKCPLVISHYCSLPMKVSTLYYLFNIIFVGAGGHGGPPEPLWSTQRTETNVGQTGIRPLLPPTCLDKRYGCRPGLWQSELNPGSSLQITLARLWWTH